MGAVIGMRQVTSDRRKLLDIGAAGPLAGLLMAIPVIVYGLSLSPIIPLAPGGWIEGNSLLVTFDLTPSGRGTLLRMTETGFRELGWEAAVLEHQFHEHVTGWDFYLPRLAPYAATLVVRS